MIGARWRTLRDEEVNWAIQRLVARPPGSGAQRHMFALSSLESYGADVAKLARIGDDWALAVIFPGRLLVPCGHGHVIRSAGEPTRRWRLMVGDVEATEPILGAMRGRERARVHRQTFMVLDEARLPTAEQLPDPGVRRAEKADLDRLTELAVRLHIDDGFGPDPGRSGARGYAQRLREGVDRGAVWCVGPVGRPVCKLEWAVASKRWGTQIAGVVVSPEARGEGVGRSAVAAVTRVSLARAAGAEHADARTVALHVRHANTPARRAYRAAGFVEREEWRLAVR